MIPFFAIPIQTITFTSFVLLLITATTILYSCCSASLLIFPHDVRQRPSVIQNDASQQEEITWKVIVVMIVASSVILIILYFFIGSILIFLKILLMISCFVSTSFALWDWFWQVIQNDKITSIVDAVLSLGFCFLWFFTEHWLITNLLTFCLCSSAITFIKVTKLSVVLIIAIAFMVYDVWWVFLSPLVFGDSVMVVAATGAVSHIPIAFAAPKGDHNALIGAGDVVLPGIVIDFFLRYDLKNRKNYFVLAMIGYIIGVALSWVMVEVMNHGQPALLWIFPSVLLTTFGVALCRGDLKDMWENGTSSNKQENSNQTDTISANLLEHSENDEQNTCV